MKKIFLSLVALVYAVSVMAQNKVYFVEDATETGEPIGHATSWAIPTNEAGVIYVLYTNNKKPIKDKQLIVKVDKKNENGVYVLADEYTVEVEPGKTWALFSIEFSVVGSYKVTVQNAAKKDLATEDLEILLAGENEVVDEITEEHAKGFKLSFTDGLNDEGIPNAPKKDFKLVGGKTKVFLLLVHPNKLKANRFTVKIVKNGDKTKGEDVFDIEAGTDWEDLVYEHEITSPGTYTIAVLSPTGKMLNFGIITVK